MALNSIHFSFNRNKNLVNGCRFYLNYIKNSRVQQEKRAKQL